MGALNGEIPPLVDTDMRLLATAGWSKCDRGEGPCRAVIVDRGWEHVHRPTELERIQTNPEEQPLDRIVMARVTGLGIQRPLVAPCHAG